MNCAAPKFDGVVVLNNNKSTITTMADVDTNIKTYLDDFGGLWSGWESFLGVTYFSRLSSNSRSSRSQRLSVSSWALRVTSALRSWGRSFDRGTLAPPTNTGMTGTSI